MNKVLFIIPTLNSGGIETYLLRFLKYKKAEINCVILVRSLSGGNLENEYLNLGVKVVKMPLGYFNIPKTYRFYKFIKTEKFNVVCDFNANFSAVVILASWIAGVGKRITFYRQASNHFQEKWSKTFVNLFLNRIVYYGSTDILSNSKSALDFFFPERWLNDKRFKVIYNGYDAATVRNEGRERVRQELNLPSGAFVIGHCGRFDKAKNHAVILKTFQRLVALDTSFYLVLVGEGTERLKDECEKLNIQKNVRLLAYRKDVHTVMSSFDCLFFPSITEGQPNALIEAWFLKIPTIVSNIPSIMEILPAELKPFSREPSDVDGFSELLNALKSKTIKYDEELIYKKALSGFSHVDRFSEFVSLLR